MYKFILVVFFVVPAAFAGTADIPAFLQVSPNLYRGGRPTLQQVADLRQAGIKMDINLQGGDLDNFAMATVIKWWEPGESAENIAAEKSAAEVSGLGFINIPLNSLAPVSDAEDLQIDHILEMMSDPSLQPVYVHCEHGIDRTGLVVALYRVKVEGWTAKAAHDEWIASGHTVTSRFFTGDLDVYFWKKARSFNPAGPE